jgi:hypothetical protein
MTPSPVNYLAALTAALAAPVTPGRGSGCGRAYVCLSGLDRKASNAVAKACKSLGLMWLKKAYGTAGNAIYIGYDNGTGHSLAKAAAVAESLRSAGVTCYDEAVGD